MRFCNQCGTGLESESAPSAPTIVTATTAASPGPVAERRLVSVLFADLVGFTPLSESRDPEEVRELLSRYFDMCRRLVELYGGVVEKFIGDAVMAVWGTPVAQEDDAERAVRAAIDLVAAVGALGDEVGARELQARAGVLTGEAAVNLGAVGEGMVAGDLVNTAARIQAEAEPGSVLVGLATRRASEGAIAFADAGEHLLKGKAEPVALYRAVRVTAARGGALRSEGLEAPFVGRERELRLVKELFHASAEQSRPHLVQITGIAGIGKSRLAWEFFKYIDGLVENVWWHRGRCLAYGEGVAYWALAEMVRSRARIVEGEDPNLAREKLAACLAEHLTDAEERAWIGPRLANLLGLEERADTDRQDLFAAWRLFFERLADRSPLIMVFEDLQWADPTLLSFIEYLLEWSTSQRMFVLALSRPDLSERQPEFARNVRNAAMLALEPLSDPQMTLLLDGYVPGLPEQLKRQVLDRAQGVPLYAVETVRMLLDRNLLVQDGAVYRPTSEIATLEVPETLHALAAARLDGLPGEERTLVHEACVLGKTFTKAALSALTGRAEAELDPLLTGLVRKEVLSLQADSRQPERGQYGFLQELLRQVAYETLSRKDRKTRHLAAVAALEQTFAGADQDVPEVIAAHLLAAADAAPDDVEAPQIRLRARDALVRAGERSAALAAPHEAQRHIDQAAGLSDDDPRMRAELLERAGTLAFEAGRTADALQRLEAAIRLHEERNDALSAARAGVALANVEQRDNRIDDAIRRLQAGLPTLEGAEPSPELAATLAQLGRLQVLHIDLEVGAANLERALRLAEMLGLEGILVEALISKGVLLGFQGRRVEARLLLEGVLPRASAAGLHQSWDRGVNNLAALLEELDQHGEARALTREMETQSRQRGDRERLATATVGSLPSLVELGEWQEALARTEEIDRMEASPRARGERIFVILILSEQGRLDAARSVLESEDWQRDANDPEPRVGFAAIEARLLRARRRPAEALASAERGLAYRTELGLANRNVKRCLVEAVEATLELDDQVRAAELLGLVDALKPGELAPWLQAQCHRLHARLDSRRGAHDNIDRNFRTAETIFAEYELVFHLAVTQLEHAEWLGHVGRLDDAGRLLGAAEQTFERLEAAPWLERLRAVGANPAEISA